MDQGVLYGMIVTCGAAQSYTLAFQQATLYWARRLAGLPLEDELAQRGVADGENERRARIRAEAEIHAWQMNEGATLQSALTPQEQTTRQIMVILCTGATVLCGWVCFVWYIGIISLLAILVISAIAARWMPSKSSDHYKCAIIKHLHSQYISHYSQGYTDKANAAMSLLEAILELDNSELTRDRTDSTKHDRIGHATAPGISVQMASDYKRPENEQNKPTFRPATETTGQMRDMNTTHAYLLYGMLLIAIIATAVITYREILAAQAYSVGPLGYPNPMSK